MRERVSGDQDREVPACSEQDWEPRRSLDDLARDLAGGNLSRRRVLRLFGAALVGTVMASVPGMALAAPCRPGEFKCGRRCCPETFNCVRGECTCPTGRERCPVGPLGTEACCPEGFDCCHILSEGVILSPICCPRGTCQCDISTSTCICATG